MPKSHIVGYAKSIIERALPRWSAIGARIHRPQFSPAYLGKNILEQDKFGQVVAGNSSDLVRAQRAGHDIVLHLQDDGPAHLFGRTTYSHNNVVFLHVANHISAAYAAPPDKEIDPYVTNVIYASDASVYLARTRMSSREHFSSLKSPYTHYIRWTWIVTTKYQRIDPKDAWYYTPHFKLRLEFENGPLFVIEPCMIMSERGTDPWMRTLHSWAVKSHEILLIGELLRAMTGQDFHDNRAYLVHFQIWFGGDLDGQVKVFATERFCLDDATHEPNRSEVIKFEAKPIITCLGAAGEFNP